jgi:predicted transcriptional regulator
MRWRRLVSSALESDTAFVDELRKALEERNIPASEFAKQAGISTSALYKIIAGQRLNLKMDTYRKIINYIRKIESANENKDRTPFIAIIAYKSLLENMPTSQFKDKATGFVVREYAARTLEDCLEAAVEAEKDGAKALVCAPVLASTLERLVSIPVVTIHPSVDSILDAARRAVDKVLEYKEVQ